MAYRLLVSEKAENQIDRDIKYIVEAHGGSVRARNDGGLVIEIWLPLREEKNENTHC